MSILTPQVRPPSPEDPENDPVFEAQAMDAAADASSAPPELVTAGSACPLDAERQPGQKCPLMHAER
jgi:hypothetical protein